MGRYSNYNLNVPKDFWATLDPDGVKRLEPFIQGKTFAEPCAGNGDLVQQLEDVGAKCLWESDIREDTYCLTKDALDITKDDLKGVQVIITNPPFSWNMLQPLLDHLPTLKPTWMLLPASFMHNVRTSPYMKRCDKVVSIGRMFWVIEDRGDPNMKGKKGKEDFCWYLFFGGTAEYGTKFYPRQTS